MLEQCQIDSLIDIVSAMNRDDVMRRLLDFRGRFPVDFTADYLDELSLDRLRHIFVALCLQSGQLPGAVIANAA